MGERVSILVTCHNRRDLTSRALEAALTQEGGYDLHAYVTDDGSTDGTAEMLNGMARVTVIAGNGDLYWAAGMARSEEEALRSHPEYLLWLNDDTILDPGALKGLMDAHDRYRGAIIVGATRDPATGELTYGGRNRASRWHPQRLELTGISGHDQFPDTMNGNVVLVPASARAKVGPIDGRFPHAYADDDYGLRARSLGVLIVQPPGTVGTCSRNDPLPLEVRGLRAWRALQGPKGLPIGAQIRFMKRHGGSAWPLILLGQQLNVLIGRRPVRVSEDR